MRAWPPRIAVQKSTVAWYSRSVPGCGPRGCCGCCAPEKMPEKMSLKLPHVDEPAPACAARAALEAGEVEAAEVDRRLLPPARCWRA